MKKIIATIILASVLSSCDKDTLTSIDTDPNSYYTTVPSTTVTYAQKQLSDYLEQNL